MHSKKVSRIRRARSTRLKIRDLAVARLTVHRTNLHVYAQVIDASGGRVLACASSLEDGFDGATCNKSAAEKVGALIAARAKAVGVAKVAFDRAGFRYHGRVKALADSAREHGLEF